MFVPFLSRDNLCVPHYAPQASDLQLKSRESAGILRRRKALRGVERDIAL